MKKMHGIDIYRHSKLYGVRQHVSGATNCISVTGSAAFDTINQNIPLNRLTNDVDIRGIALAQFE